jgi:hypothetical protein
VKGRHRPLWLGLLVFAIAALVRVVPALRQDLWADELFSLAVATGHSLEHPATAAVPASGDFVEPARGVPASSFQRYLEHESPAAGAGRVVRAVLLSDTSPPLYYLTLNLWTRVVGTSDGALHGYSVLWALATLPLLWLLGLRVGGAREALFACALFALAPLSLYYSVEGRMYAMLWFLSAATAWLTIRLHDRGGTAPAVLWVVVSAAGLLTHYFYVFVWSACVLWLTLRPGRSTRWVLATAVAIVLLSVAPWYRLVPASLAQWRVTAHWLDGRPGPVRLLTAPLLLGWSYLSGRGVWGGLQGADFMVAAVVLTAAVGWTRRDRSAVVAGPRALLWLWAIAACTGPVAFDLLRGTSTSLISRYALAGMPAGLLLTALALGAAPARLGGIGFALLVAAWLPGIRSAFDREGRRWEPYRTVAAKLRRSAVPGDLILVHSIPSGVLGIARYLPPDATVAAWVGQLGRRRVPEDVAAMVEGHSRIAFVRMHEVGEPAPEETWLRANATLVREERTAGVPILYFAGPSTRR